MRKMAKIVRDLFELPNLMQNFLVEISSLRIALDELRQEVADISYAIERLPWAGVGGDCENDMEMRDFDHDLNTIRKLAPVAFDVWQNLESGNESCYSGFPTHSCSVSGHKEAGKFRSFLRKYVTGCVLDIGCGPQGMPHYLSGYPLSKICGIDPLKEGDQKHPFRFVQGMGEFLPWRAGSFETVVVATSLDHVLLLDKCVSEIHRVLKRGGVFLNWVSFVEGAKPHNPYGSVIEPIDEFHLFHFDRVWYEEMISRNFILVESEQRIGQAFYCWLKDGGGD